MDEQEPKITILPPQKAPKLLTVRKAISTLGEHCMAFLNTNNKKGFMVEEPPEEPVEELMVMLFLTILEFVTNNKPLKGVMCEKIKPPKTEIRRRELAAIERQRAQQEEQTALLYVKHIAATEEQSEKEILIAATISRKHIVATRVNHSIRATIPGEMEQLVETIRASERYKAMMATGTIKESQFLQSLLPYGPLNDIEYLSRRQNIAFERLASINGMVVPAAEIGIYQNVPKSGASGANRINPYL